MNAILSLYLNVGTADSSAADDIVDTHRVQPLNNKAHATSCKQVHSKHVDESILANLSRHQMHIKGARKCCQCAYSSGYQQGTMLQNFISLDIDSLGEVNPNTDGQYKSIHQAFALGYSDGVNYFLNS